MEYTQELLDSLETAYQELITGENMVRLTIGDKTVEYGRGDLARLEGFIESVKAQLNPRSRFWLTRTSKGL